MAEGGFAALSGFAGLAAALENIQDRRLREALLQRQLTEGQGEWTPGGGAGGVLGFFDRLLGYNPPGTVGFGGQTYQFTPYGRMTEDDVRRFGLTTPETVMEPGKPSLNLAPPGTGFGRPAAELAQQTPGMTFAPADMSVSPFVPEPGRSTTREVPIGGFVGRRKDPRFMDLLLQERIKEAFERFKMREQQKLFDRFDAGGRSPDVGGATFDLPGTATPPSTQVPTQAPTQGPGDIIQTPLSGVQEGPPAGAGMPPVPRTADLSPQFLAKTRRVAHTVEARPEDLLQVMAFETGGTFNPAEPNRAGSGATGLIQFTRDTARRLGTTTEALAKMTPEQQLDYVERYLMPFKGRIGTLPDLYMALFKPSAIGASPDTPLYVKDRDGLRYAQNAALDTAGKGFITVADAVQAVQRYGAPPGPATSGGSTPQTTPGGRAPQTMPGQGASAAGDLPPGTVQVAGPGAGVTPAPTGTPLDVAPPGTVLATPPEPFALTPEGRQRIESNNRRTLANNQRLQALDQERRRVQAGLRAGMPGMADRLNALEASSRALRAENTNFYDDSQKALAEEQKEWRGRREKLEERRRRPGELATEKTAERTAEEQYLDTQPVGEHPRVKSEEYFDKKTGDPIDDSMLTRQWRAHNKAGNLTRLADTESRKQLTTLKMLEPLLKQYTALVQYAYGTDTATGKPGPLAQYARTPSATASAMMQQALQSDPVLQAKRRALEGQLQSVVRALGSRGDLNQQELEAAKGLIANMDASMGLGLSLSSGPMVGTGGLGVGVGGAVKPSFSVPDTPAVGFRLANELVDLVNSRIGSLLRNKDYQGTPAITLPGTPGAVPALPTSGATRLHDMTPDQIRQAPASALTPLKNTQDLARQGFSPAQADAIRTRVLGRAEADLGPAMGQATGLNPQWGKSRIPQMTPAAIRSAPPEVIADVSRVADIPGLNTEQRKALAARLRQRNAEAVAGR